LNEFGEFTSKTCPHDLRTRHCLTAAFAMHDTLARKGDMHLTDFSEYVKG
jgi:hypothetical protein